MGREEERLVSRRETLLTVFRERFLELPAELLDRIEAVRDAAVLQAAIRQAVHVERPEDVTL